jgi:hypothetical protein
MCLPELLFIGRRLREHRRPAGEISGDGPMPKDVSQPIAKLRPDVRNPFVGGTAMRTRIAAIFDERDVGIERTEDVIVCGVYGPLEPIAR